jgi:hypothetical protein
MSKVMASPPLPQGEGTTSSLPQGERGQEILLLRRITNKYHHKKQESIMPTTDPRIDAYIAKSALFAQPVLAHLRAVVHSACPSAQEAVKWSMPFFMYEGKILANMAAFKAHCSFGFWMGDRVAVTGKSDEGMGQFGRITSLKDLPSKHELTAMIKKAMALIDAGEKSPIALRPRKVNRVI